MQETPEELKVNLMTLPSINEIGGREARKNAGRAYSSSDEESEEEEESIGAQQDAAGLQKTGKQTFVNPMGGKLKPKDVADGGGARWDGKIKMPKVGKGKTKAKRNKNKKKGKDAEQMQTSNPMVRARDLPACLPAATVALSLVLSDPRN